MSEVVTIQKESSNQSTSNNRKAYIVISSGQIFITKAVIEGDSFFELVDALIVNVAPNGKIGIAPPLFGNPKELTVRISKPLNVVSYEADPNITDQYYQIVMSMKTGIVPAKAIPQTTNTKPQLTKPELKIVE